MDASKVVHTSESVEAPRSETPRPPSRGSAAPEFLLLEPRFRAFALAAMVALVATGVMLQQQAPRDRDAEPTGLAWWTSPVVRNAWLTLPRVSGGGQIAGVDVDPEDKRAAAVIFNDGAVLAAPSGSSPWRVLRRRGNLFALSVRARGQFAYAVTLDGLVRETRALEASAAAAPDPDGTWTSVAFPDPIRAVDFVTSPDGARVVDAVAVGPGGAFRLQDGAWERVPLPSSDPTPRPARVERKGAAGTVELTSATVPSPRRPPPPGDRVAEAVARTLELSDVRFSADGASCYAIGAAGVVRLFPDPRRFPVEAPDLRRALFVGRTQAEVWATGPTGGVARLEGDTFVPVAGMGSVTPTRILFDATGRFGVVHRSDGTRFVTRDGGRAWSPRPRSEVAVVALLPDGRAWGVSGDDTVWRSDDGGDHWARDLTVGDRLVAGAVSRDGRVWVSTSAGELLSSDDHGRTWGSAYVATAPITRVSVDEERGVLRAGTWRETLVRPLDGGPWAVEGPATPAEVAQAIERVEAAAIPVSMDRPWGIEGGGAVIPAAAGMIAYPTPLARRWPAPWYWLALAVVLVLVARALIPARPREGRGNVASRVVSDQPIATSAEDALAFSPIAGTIADFIRNEATKPPITLAVTGSWGTGKSSILNLLRTELGKYDYRPIVFNAWHHEGEQDLLASLFATIVGQGAPRGLAGLEFRARLAVRRWLGWKGAVIAALAVATAFSAGFMLSHPHALTLVSKLARLFSDDAPDFSKAAGFGIASAVSSALFGVGFLFKMVESVRSFGAKVAKMSASFTAGSETAAAREPIGFRLRFAHEFGEVARALAPRRMVIFIDDIDRCRPDSAMRILETADYLMAAGPCVVVLAFSREIVEAHVAASAALQTVQPAAAVQSEAERAKARLELARRYLEKLIHVEIAVPTPTPELEKQLLTTTPAGNEPSSGAMRWAIAGALAIGGLLLAGTWAYGKGYEVAVSGTLEAQLQSMLPPADGGREKPILVRLEPGARLGELRLEQLGAASCPADTGERKQGAVAGAASPAGQPAAPQPAAATPTRRTPTTTAGGGAGGAPPSAARAGPEVVARAPFFPYWLLSVPVAMVLLGVIGGAFRRPGTVVRDSDAFSAALGIWHPVVRRRNSTPRALKRFVNRVRFHATRLLREAVASGEAAAMPEEQLVAYAAIEAVAPEVAASPDLMARLWSRSPVPDSDPDLAEVLAAAVKAHSDTFPTRPFDPMGAQEAYRGASRGVRVS